MLILKTVDHRRKTEDYLINDENAKYTYDTRTGAITIYPGVDVNNEIHTADRMDNYDYIPDYNCDDDIIIDR